MASYTAKVDAVAVTDKIVWVVEIKTRNQCIKGMHDAYEGFGQVLMNRDRFREDYFHSGTGTRCKGTLAR